MTVLGGVKGTSSSSRGAQPGEDAAADMIASFDKETADLIRECNAIRKAMGPSELDILLKQALQQAKQQGNGSGGVGAPGEGGSNTNWYPQAPGASTVPGGPEYDVPSDGSTPTHVMSRAIQVDKIAPPYKWGGGHGARVTSAAQIKAGLDCSGAVSYAIGLKTPLVSGALAKIGKPGEGKNVTIYANAEHTFLKITDPKTGLVRYWGTSGFARPNGGAGWFTQAPSPAYLARFEKRHLPGQ